MIAGRDGFLYGAIAEFSGGRGTGGGVFRVAPDDGYRMLHRFDVTRTSQEPNAGGASPTDLIVMGRDGCLHGLTKEGGLFGYGVLYRLRPDGEFSVVAHLDPSQLPAGTGFSASACSGFLEGSDNAFYTCLMFGWGPNILRIDRDGVMSFVGEVNHVTRAFTDPARPDELICVATRLPLADGTGLVDQVKITRFLVTGSQQGPVQVITSPAFASSFRSLWPLAWTSRGLLVRGEWLNQPGYSHRLFLVKPNGELETVADFGWNGANGLPPAMDQLVHFSDEGTLYYATHGTDFDGSTLLERDADGSVRVICGFADGRLIQAIPGGAEDLCGVSFSSKVYLPAGGSRDFSRDWMAVPERHEVIDHAKRGGLFFQVSLTDSPFVNSRPLAVQDVVRTKPRNEFMIRNLRNDWDPQGGELRINHVAEPERGYFASSLTQCLYRSLDGGRSSAFASYDVVDGSQRVSVGSILMLGNPTGSYRDPGLTVGRRPFAIEVKRDGTFTAAVPRSNGTPVVMTGTIDWHNRGLAQAVLPSGEALALSVHLMTDGDSEAALDYRIRSSAGGESTGQAVLGR